jgi:hypothetical protein
MKGHLFYFQATCPHRDQVVLSPSEILKITEERLSRPDISPEGSYSGGFVKLLRDFVNECVFLWKKTRRSLNLDEDCLDNKNYSLEEKVAANASGISAKQLQVWLSRIFNAI